MDVSLPWELNPALDQSRLVLLAQTAVDVRNKAFSEANREEGDTSWGIGCKAHERLGHALCRLAESGKHPWLSVHRDGLYLMPLIEGVAVRVYRGPADKPSQRHLEAARIEHNRRSEPRQMAFSFMGQPVEPDGPWFWMMAVETDVEGRALRAVFFQANEAGGTRNAWEAPVEGLSAAAPVAAAPAAAAPAPPEKPARPARPRAAAGASAKGALLSRDGRPLFQAQTVPLPLVIQPS
ncbi:hypothetical protein SOCE26_026240 [Sorangium cellulosum]|uniref:Uncharacterized protein n=1 Tax=Sorangium cellulosum TaxID=56 RepID=A0A2L0EPK0_SORCE|nr:hypothetical protein [Sorangium cellulosum]AUX41214.1 hypothetical protein SOCE26_026240 [Sorangium cellulosum]